MGNILLISAPGAGKGVVSKYLKEKYNYNYVSMGNLLREEAKTNKTINEILKTGAFVDNNIVYGLLEKILKEDNKSNYVFEGFPRDLNQNSEFEKILKKYDIILDRVIYVYIEKEIAEKRITGRLMCSNCNEIYNKYFDDVSDNKCKVCSFNLIKRNDDKIETYEARYDTFVNKTLPLVDYYKNKNMLYTIFNNETIDKTYNQIDVLMEKGDE